MTNNPSPGAGELVPEQRGLRLRPIDGLDRSEDQPAGAKTSKEETKQEKPATLRLVAEEPTSFKQQVEDKRANDESNVRAKEAATIATSLVRWHPLCKRPGAETAV